MTINYNEIQRRVDFLYRQIWFNPDAYFPTCFGYANDDNDVRNMVQMFDDIEKDGVLRNDISVDDKVELEGMILGEVEDPSVKGPVAKGLVTCDLAIITKVEGLKIPETPIDRSNGRIVAKERREGQSETVKISFLLQDGATALTFNKEWQNKWYRHTGTSRKLRAMDDTKCLPEGYLGMDYVHILPDGTCERIGHLFITGLIPTKLDVGRGFSLGPGGDKNNNVTILTVSYVYSQAMLMIKTGSNSSEIIYFD